MSEDNNLEDKMKGISNFSSSYNEIYKKTIFTSDEEKIQELALLTREYCEEVSKISEIILNDRGSCNLLSINYLNVSEGDKLNAHYSALLIYKRRLEKGLGGVGDIVNAHGKVSRSEVYKALSKIPASYGIRDKIRNIGEYVLSLFR